MSSDCDDRTQLSQRKTDSELDDDTRISARQIDDRTRISQSNRGSSGDDPAEQDQTVLSRRDRVSDIDSDKTVVGSRQFDDQTVLAQRNPDSGTRVVYQPPNGLTRPPAQRSVSPTTSITTSTARVAYVPGDDGVALPVYTTRTAPEVATRERRVPPQPMPPRRVEEQGNSRAPVFALWVGLIVVAMVACGFLAWIVLGTG